MILKNLENNGMEEIGLVTPTPGAARSQGIHSHGIGLILWNIPASLPETLANIVD